MNSLQVKIISSTIGLLMIISCGKSYNCKCTGITTIKNGTTTTTTKLETASSEKYLKRETARLMCVNNEAMSSSPTSTIESTCILE